VAVSIGSISRASSRAQAAWLCVADGAVLAADARHDGGDGAGVTRVRVILRAVRGGDRGGAACNRHGPELAVGLGGVQRRDGRRLRRHRLEHARRTPRANTRESRTYACLVAGAAAEAA
jgi:hypothetical protein